MPALRQASNTPEGVEVVPRNLTFDLGKVLATDWLDNDPFMTAFFNAMSLSFPSGEKQFINSVRAYEDRITDEKLLQEVKGFYKQEGVHSREHRKYNKLLCEQRGYNLEELEGVYLQLVEKSNHNPRVTPLVRLASTVALEHFTASLGESVLEGRLLKGVDDSIGDLWKWHSMEELEHKAIAFDVYKAVGGHYTLRTRMMRLSMWLFFTNALKVTLKILRHDKQLWKWKTLKSAAKFLCAKNGFVRLHLSAYKDFFREDFHPWDDDNRALLEHWEKVLEPTLTAA